MPRPLSLVVLGNSVAIMANPRPHREDGTYGEVLAGLVGQDGRTVTLALESRWFEMITAALSEYEVRVTRHAPDVVVIGYGYNEQQPWLVPIPLLRHLMTDHRTTRPVGARYRERIVPTLWRWVRALRRGLSPVARARTWQLRPTRFARALRHLIRLSRNQHRALVLVLDVNPPSRKVEHFLPGMRERHAVYQRTVATVVEAFDDPDVRLVPASSVVDELGEDAALPDGIHFSPEAHRRVGRMLADEVEAWLDGRPVRDRGAG